MCCFCVGTENGYMGLASIGFRVAVTVYVHVTDVLLT